MSDKEDTMAARCGLGGEISQMWNSRRQALSSRAWILQTGRVGTPERTVGWGEVPARDTSPRHLTGTGPFRMENGGRMS